MCSKDSRSDWYCDAKIGGKDGQDRQLFYLRRVAFIDLLRLKGGSERRIETANEEQDKVLTL